MSKDTCDRCVHCTHEITDEISMNYYYCEVEDEYISETYALNEELSCDAFVENLDDCKTEKH